MAKNTWVGATSGNGRWDVASNWSAGSVPASGGDDISIGENGTYNVVIQTSDPAYFVRNLTLGGGGSPTLTDQGDLSVTNTLTIDNGSTFTVTSAATASLSSLTLNGTATILDQGVITVSGQISGSGTFLVDGSELFTNSISGTDTYTLTKAGVMTVTDAVSSKGNIVFGDQTADKLDLQGVSTSYSAAITGFGGNNTIDLQSLAYNANYTYQYSGSSIVINNGAKTVFTLTNINNPSLLSFSNDGAGGTRA